MICCVLQRKKSKGPFPTFFGQEAVIYVMKYRFKLAKPKQKHNLQTSSFMHRGIYLIIQTKRHAHYL